MRRVVLGIGLIGALAASAGLHALSPAGAQPVPRDTIYETQFEDPAQAATEWGFPAGTTEVTERGFTAAITPGALTVTVDGAPNAWISPSFGSGEIPELPANQAVEARVALVVDDSSALVGVACRADLGRRSVGYAFLIGSDGYYTIGRYDGRGNTERLVNDEGDLRSDAVDPTGANIVRGDCTGADKVRVTLWVNGEKVASTVDRTPPKRTGDRAFVVTEVERGRPATVDVTAFAAHAR